MKLKIYTYGNCSSCKRATKWLRSHKLPFTEEPIRDRPPSRIELETMLAAVGGNRRRLCNTSGRDYRRLQLGEKIGVIPISDLVALLRSNGNLIKRPFLIARGIALVGFDEVSWAESLGRPQ